MSALPRGGGAMSWLAGGRRVAAGLAAIGVFVALAPGVTSAAERPSGSPPSGSRPGTGSSQAVGSVAAAAGSAVSLPAVADTYVVAERPLLGYGTAEKLTAANWASWHSEAYVRFELPPDPDHRPVTGVRVDLTFQRLDQQPARVELRAVSGAWDEATTYANRPDVGAVVSEATLPGQGTAGVSLDVTAVVRAAGTYSFALTNPTAQSAAVVSSREHGSDAPRLVVEYGAPALCGAAFNVEVEGETYQEALARIDGYYNGLEIARVFYSGLPQAWPGKLDTGGRPMIVSFKAPPGEVIAGAHDARVGEWFRTAPSDQDIFWTYWHEPEQEIAAGEFTAEQYRQAWQRLAGLADQVANPRLHNTLILMGWSVDPASGRDWRDYYPGRESVDVLGWDLYNHGWSDGTYRAPAAMFANVIGVSRGESLPFGIAELGSPMAVGDDGTGRAAWLRELAAHLSESGAVFVAYYDLDRRSRGGPDYRLRDATSMAAWREFCT